VKLNDSYLGSFTDNWNALWESIGPHTSDDVPVACTTTATSASSKRNISGNAFVDSLNTPSAMTVTSSPRAGSMADLKDFTGQLIQNVISKLKTSAARCHLTESMSTASPWNVSMAALGGDERKRDKHLENGNSSCSQTESCLRSAKEHR
jgi:hypothetical protein